MAMYNKKASRKDLRKTMWKKTTLSEKSNIKKLNESDISMLLEMFIESMKENIIEKRGLVIQDFGAFSRKIKKRTKKKMPNSPETIIIPQRVDLSFSVSPKFIEKLK